MGFIRWLSINHRETTHSGKFWDRDWSLTEFMNATERRREHNFYFLTPITNQSFIHPIEYLGK